MRDKWNKLACVSTLLVGLGVQCFAHAGFAVGETQSTEAVYSGNEAEAPQFLTKYEAQDYLRDHDDYVVRVSYALDNGETTTVDQAAEQDFFFENPYSRVLSVAESSSNAIALAQPKPQVFFAMPNETLKQTIQRWGLENGNPVQWQSNIDYRIQYFYEFRGNLTDEGGPLDSILASFMHTHNPLGASIYSNNVIVVEPLKYKANEVS